MEPANPCKRLARRVALLVVEGWLEWLRLYAIICILLLLFGEWTLVEFWKRTIASIMHTGPIVVMIGLLIASFVCELFKAALVDKGEAEDVVHVE